MVESVSALGERSYGMSLKIVYVSNLEGKITLKISINLVWKKFLEYWSRTMFFARYVVMPMLLS